MVNVFVFFYVCRAQFFVGVALSGFPVGLL